MMTSMRSPRGVCRVRRASCVGAALLAIAGPADAHALLRSSAPAVGATVAAPAEVAISYSEGVEPRFSTIAVTNAQGQRVDDGAPHVAAGDDKRLIVALKPLPPGVYHVQWHATSVDTHKTQGAFDFTVK